MSAAKKSRFHEEMELELHEMCQPLTTLRCRLELAKMLSEDEGPESTAALLEAVDEGLKDIQRVFVAAERLRNRVMEQE